MGKNAKMKKAKREFRASELKLDFGCGKNPRDGFEGVDIRDFGQKWKVNLAERAIGHYKGDGVPTTYVGMPVLFKSWPWKDASVDEAHCSHFIEHLEPEERVHFVNELYRVLKPGAKCTVITPHWASSRAYGDMTHKWPPVSEFWFYYLSETWRTENAPHNDGYTCDLVVTWGYTVHQQLNGRNPDYVQDKLAWNKEAAQDMVATFTRAVI